LRSRIIWTTGILSLIGVIQLVLPLLDIGVTPLSEPTGTLKAIIDRAVIPGVMTYDTWDSHGILGAVSASSVIMIGGIAGSILRDGKPANKRKTLNLIYVGAAMVIVAIVFSPYYPIIRRAWTVTLNLLTGGLAFLLLATIYYFIDVLKWSKGIFVNITYFFKIIGMNALTIFIVNRFINFSHTSSYLVGWLEFFQGGWVIILADIILKWMFLWYLYKNRIFIRI
jgi:predicted acyltransferase